ncbi:uncharacterized protein LOC108909932 [Anoplophora glabripennis]|uniref:uncharacterized protein LOC108909932 n=1 Tax=Anoplophora glabripennis TaxID=217634 RepID=UPI00087587AA|nr:uncharacterized protein LOC108909932 [Anoplophora glabripennis]
MNCCLLKVLLLLTSSATILACPQHHHGHHYEPARSNTLEDTNVFKEDNHLPEPEENPKIHVHKKVTGDVEEKKIILQIDDESVPETVQPQAPLNSSVVNENHTNSENTTKYIECVCALFSLRHPIETDVPLMSKTFHNVSCDGHVSGSDVCSKVCVTFATSHHKEKDNIICSQLHNATSLTAYLHSKHCEENGMWTFTGLETQEPLCCKNREPIGCEEVASTTIIDY